MPSVNNLTTAAHSKQVPVEERHHCTKAADLHQLVLRYNLGVAVNSDTEALRSPGK
jgi:hypothetical protein